jgi:arginine N-succinyltransferase
MYVIRPIAAGDLDALIAFAARAGHGFTTLPHDRELLTKRIRRSLRSFAEMGDEPAGESYLFALEDLDAGKVIGTCGIVSKVGGFEPFYAYRIESSVHESEFLGVRKEIQVLHLVSQHSGPCEICSLFLAPEHRRSGGNLSRLLSLSRFLFMAEFVKAFEPTVIAELRGFVDDAGRSPFWDAIGRHFFDIEYPRADYLSMVNKRFIADLMPKEPIYIPLLPIEAQKVIGVVHDQTRPAQKLLESEGFRFNNLVDIFEAGPTMTCALKDVRTVRTSRRATIADVSDSPIEGAEMLVSNVRKDFRATVAAAVTTTDGVTLAKQTAAALQVGKGDAVRIAPLRGEAPAHVAEGI